MTTNVRPEELNYDSYEMGQYDRDIVNSIPFHGELHACIRSFLQEHYHPQDAVQAIDLGVGTGVTSRLLLDILPEASLVAVDFSEKMLQGAKKRLGNAKTTFLLGDYADMPFALHSFDLAISVIGLHHQTNEGKRAMFQKIYTLLKPTGAFLFGDLVTYADTEEAAYNDALHFHHLVEHAADEATLREWAYHHAHLNQLAPIEDQIAWLRNTGFSVEQLFLQMNTSLLLCTKSE